MWNNNVFVAETQDFAPGSGMGTDYALKADVESCARKEDVAGCARKSDLELLVTKASFDACISELGETCSKLQAQLELMAGQAAGAMSTSGERASSPLMLHVPRGSSTTGTSGSRSNIMETGPRRFGATETGLKAGGAIEMSGRPEPELVSPRTSPRVQMRSRALRAHSPHSPGSSADDERWSSTLLDRVTILETRTDTLEKALRDKTSGHRIGVVDEDEVSQESLAQPTSGAEHANGHRSGPERLDALETTSQTLAASIQQLTGRLDEMSKAPLSENNRGESSRELRRPRSLSSRFKAADEGHLGESLGSKNEDLSSIVSRLENVEKTLQDNNPSQSASKQENQQTDLSIRMANTEKEVRSIVSAMDALEQRFKMANISVDSELQQLAMSVDKRSSQIDDLINWREDTGANVERLQGGGTSTQEHLCRLDESIKDIQRRLDSFKAGFEEHGSLVQIQGRTLSELMEEELRAFEHKVSSARQADADTFSKRIDDMCDVLTTKIRDGDIKVLQDKSDTVKPEMIMDQAAVELLVNDLRDEMLHHLRELEEIVLSSSAVSGEHLAELHSFATREVEIHAKIRELHEELKKLQDTNNARSSGDESAMKQIEVVRQEQRVLEDKFNQIKTAPPDDQGASPAAQRQVDAQLEPIRADIRALSEKLDTQVQNMENKAQEDMDALNLKVQSLSSKMTEDAEKRSHDDLETQRAKNDIDALMSRLVKLEHAGETTLGFGDSIDELEGRVKECERIAAVSERLEILTQSFQVSWLGRNLGIFVMAPPTVCSP